MAETENPTIKTGFYFACPLALFFAWVLKLQPTIKLGISVLHISNFKFYFGFW